MISKLVISVALLLAVVQAHWGRGGGGRGGGRGCGGDCFENLSDAIVDAADVIENNDASSSLDILEQCVVDSEELTV